MGKKLIITLGIFVILVASVSLYFLFTEKIDVLMMTPDDVYAHALKQTEVQNHLGNQRIESWDTSPSSVAFSVDPWQSYPELNRVITDNKPSCLNKLQTGELVRTITLHTSSKSVWVVYSVDKNEIICVLSYSIDKYKD